MTNMVFRERTLINSMLSMAPNIVFAPNIMQNAEHRHWTQDTNAAHFRSFLKRSLAVMRSISFVGQVFFASGLLSFCESGESRDAFVSRKMFQEFQKQIFDRFDQINSEVGEIKDIQLDQRGTHLFLVLMQLPY